MRWTSSSEECAFVETCDLVRDCHPRALPGREAEPSANREPSAQFACSPGIIRTGVGRRPIQSQTDGEAIDQQDQDRADHRSARSSGEPAARAPSKRIRALIAASSIGLHTGRAAGACRCGETRPGRGPRLRNRPQPGSSLPWPFGGRHDFSRTSLRSSGRIRGIVVSKHVEVEAVRSAYRHLGADSGRLLDSAVSPTMRGRGSRRECSRLCTNSTARSRGPTTRRRTVIWPPLRGGFKGGNLDTGGQDSLKIFHRESPRKGFLVEELVETLGLLEGCGHCPAAASWPGSYGALGECAQSFRRGSAHGPGRLRPCRAVHGGRGRGR